MAGLMIVFMFIAISYMIEVRSGAAKEQQRASRLEEALTDAQTAKERADALNKELERTNETVREIAASYSKIQTSLYAALAKEFDSDLPKWNATLERDNTIRFNEPEVLFLVGEAQIRDRFKAILDDFFPRYIRIIYSEQFASEIEELRIEGHTSSIWKGALSDAERYLKNADLSQKRALQVLTYCYQLETVGSRRAELIRDMRANGLSFARPVLNSGGVEDVNLSQRVEFRVTTKTRERILKILEAGNEGGGQ